ncbi:MAG: hypothetical protein ACLP9L_10660, partial [Thermoguttaceae bacterium]
APLTRAAAPGNTAALAIEEWEQRTTPPLPYSTNDMMGLLKTCRLFVESNCRPCFQLSSMAKQLKLGPTVTSP